MRSGRLVVRGTRPMLAQAMQPLARDSRIRKLAINFEQIFRRSTPVQTSQQNRGGRFENWSRRVVQRVGEPHVSGVFAKTHGQREPGVRMKFNDEIRRATLASQASVDALENALTAGDKFGFQPRCGEQWPLIQVRAKVVSSRRLSAHGRGRKFFFGLVNIGERVFGAFDSVLQRVFVGIELGIVRANFLKRSQKLFRFGFEKF